MSLRLKILAIMALPVAVLVAATIALFVSRNVTSAALDAERHTTALHDAFGKVLVDLNDAETATSGYVITHDNSYLRTFDQDRTELPRDLHAITASSFRMTRRALRVLPSSTHWRTNGSRSCRRPRSSRR